MIAGGELGPVHFVHGAYLQDWLLEPTDFSWRLEPDKGRRELRGRRHRIALVRSRPARHRPAHRRGAGRSDDGGRHAAASRRRRPRRSRAAATPTREACRDQQRGSRDDPPALRRRRKGQRVGRAGLRRAQERSVVRGQRPPARRCAGSRSGRTSCGSGAATRANAMLREGSRRCSRRRARAYAHLPGGHQEGWADAFCNVMRDIYGFIAAGKRPGDPRPPAFATFEDGYHSALRRRRHSREPSARRRLDAGRALTRMTPMKLGLFTPVFGTLQRERRCWRRCGRSAQVQAIELAPAAGRAAIISTSTRCSTTKPCAARVPQDDRRRRADDQRAVVPRQSAASGPRDGARGRRGVSQDRPAGRAARRAGRRHVLRLPGRFRRRRHIPTGSRTPWPPEFLEVLDWQWEKKAIPYWSDAAQFAADHGVKVALEAHPGLHRLQRRDGAEAARRRRARTSASTSIRATSSGRASTCRRRSARSATRSSTCTPRTSRSIRRTSRSTASSTPRAIAGWRSDRGCSAASAGDTTSSNGSASSARCGSPATTT